MIVFGQRMYGRVDQLSNGWFVATRFAHIDFVPLFPIGTWLVMAEAGRSFNGIKMSLSWRSVLMTYLRLLAIVAAGGGIIFAIMSFTKRYPTTSDEVIGVIAAIVGVAMVILAHHAWRKASTAREEQLMKFLEAKTISGTLPAARGFDVAPAGMEVPTATIAENAAPVSEAR